MDDIKRKLERIDRQLAGMPGHEEVFGTSPLLFIALGLMLGIVIQHYFGLPVIFWFYLLLCFTIAAVAFFVFKSNSEKSRHVSAYLALGCFLCLGSIRLSNYTTPKPNDIKNFVSDEPVLATIRGCITTEPYVNKYPDWEFAQFMPTDPGSSFYIKITEIETSSGWAKTTGKVRIFVDEPVLDLKPGDYIQAYCWLDIFHHPTNPGQFDTADFLAKNDVYISASIKSRQGIRILRNNSADFLIFTKTKIKQLAQTALLGDIPEDNAGNGLLQALLLGYRGDIDSDTYQAFRKTGLLHFISLSGLHFGILIGMIWWICKVAGLMKPSRAIVCIAAVIIFLIIVPPRAPTLRASIITLMFCLSFLFRRHSNSINTLSFAAIILLLVRPAQLFEAGWQLSFSSVSGIILFSKNIEYFIKEKVENLIRNKSSNEKKSKHIVLKYLATNSVTLFSVGLAAWTASAGILLYHFNTITPLASLWTVLIFPLVAVILIAGFLKVVMFFILPTLSSILGYIVTKISVLLILIVKLIANLGISQLVIGHFPLSMTIFYYCVIAVSIFAYHSRSALKKNLIITAVPLIVIFPVMLKWQRIHNDNLILTCLDVGHGQAIFIQFPDNDNVLFDTGSMYRSNIGERIVNPFMDYSGISKIDDVIISHNDLDHINGIPEVVEYCDVGEVYAGNDFFKKTDKWGTASFLSECLRQAGSEIKPLDEKTVFNKKGNIKLLWPKIGVNYEKELSDNNKSLVTFIEFAGKKILLCSDIEQFAQKELLRLYPDLKADIVIVPHHGSTNTLEPTFLESIDAEVLICSTDKTPKLQNSKQLFYTSRDGAISISIDKKGKIEISTYNKCTK